MKKFFIFSLVTIHSLFACEAIWNNGPTQLLQDIFSVLEIDGVEDLELATEQSNFRWIRPKGLERWDVYVLVNANQRRKLGKRIQNSELAKEKLPIKNHYDAVLVHGGTAARGKSRIQFLVNLYKKGVTFDKIYLLGSTRDLKIGNQSDIEMAAILEGKGILPTEMKMMVEVWHTTDMPEALRAVPLEQIESGQRPDGTRANTEDTLQEMIKTYDEPRGKSLLFISNNPYICYQDAVSKKVLAPYGVEIETVGEGIRNPDALGESIEDEKIENVLDTVARCLTNIKQMLTSAGHG